jgi:hypothetical protein
MDKVGMEWLAGGWVLMPTTINWPQALLAKKV